MIVDFWRGKQRRGDSEVLWETSSEERCHDVEDFVACCFGTWKALQNLRTTGCEEVGPEGVFGEIVDIQGEEVDFVEAFESHSHAGGGSFLQRREFIGPDIFQRSLVRLGGCGKDIWKGDNDIRVGPFWRFKRCCAGV